MILMNKKTPVFADTGVFNYLPRALYGVVQRKAGLRKQKMSSSIILDFCKAGVKELLRSIDMAKTPFPAPAGYRWIFCKSFKHWRSGKTVYPKKSDCFCFLVRV